jgi:hypothetical protein
VRARKEVGSWIYSSTSVQRAVSKAAFCTPYSSSSK